MIGKVLAERYEILQQVGVGGMAYVYRAEDKLLMRDVAVKVLKQQYVEDEEFSKKFQIEAQSAASLSHPNIVNIYDVGTDIIDGQIIQFIIMEYIEGKTLKDLIVEKGHLSNEEIVDYGIQIASALSAAHNKHIVHRDIKPQNILITDYGVVKVTDFGIARISTSATITYTSSILGTVHYISPEQAKGKFIDHKSDLYSLGIVLYEMATGKVPFDAENSVGIALKHIQDAVIPPMVENPELTQALNDIIMKCLEKEPEDRYKSAGRLARALSAKEILEKQPSYFTEPNPAIIRKDEDEVAVYQSSQDDKARDKKEEKTIGSFFLKAFVALLILALLFFGYQSLRGLFVSDKVQVPDVVGKSEAEALALILDKNLNYNIVRKPDENVEEGYVIRQRPDAGSMIKKESRVEIQVSDGNEVSEMPDLVGMTLEDARIILESRDISVISEKHAYSDTVEKGLIIETNPVKGEGITSQSQVALTISGGTESVVITMPNLLGASQASAVESIVSSGLKVGAIDKMYSVDYPEDTVMWQSYDEDVELLEDTPVDIVISRGPREEAPARTDLGSDIVDLTDDDTRQAKIYRLEIVPPSGDGDFNLVIVRNVDGHETKVYDKSHPRGGDIFEVAFKDYSDVVYKFYYDDEFISETQ